MWSVGIFDRFAGVHFVNGHPPEAAGEFYAQVFFQSDGVGVFDYSFRSIDHFKAVGGEFEGQIHVFVVRFGEGFVEAAGMVEGGFPEGGGIRIDEIDVLQFFQHPVTFFEFQLDEASDQGFLAGDVDAFNAGNFGISEGGGHVFQPAGLGDAVAIGEKDDVAEGFAETVVAGGGRTGVLLMQDADGVLS